VEKTVAAYVSSQMFICQMERDLIFNAARRGFQNLFAPETRSVFWKMLGLTLLVLAGLWFAVRALVVAFVAPWLSSLAPTLPQWAGWIVAIAEILSGLGLAFALIFLISPVTAVVAGLFLDDVADVIEQQDYASDPAGRAMSFGSSIVSSIKFFGIVILGNIMALLLLLIPGVNLIAFFMVNGYLLGREFFEFAAMRFRSPQQAREFRAKHAKTVFMAGLVIAAFLAIPFLNLLTPLFAASLMVHLHKSISRKDPSFAKQLGR